MVRALLTVGLDFGIKRIEVRMSNLSELPAARKLQDGLMDKVEEINTILAGDKE